MTGFLSISYLNRKKDFTYEPYSEALSFMKERVEKIRKNEASELVWFLEHPPLYTAGTSAKEEDLLDKTRFPIFAAGRGGQWTYHGPGQRIVYVMLDLNRPHNLIPARDVRAFVKGLESWIILTLADFGVTGEIRDGRVGVWVVDPVSGKEDKIAAIGIRLSRWVSFHGISLNVNPNPEHFSGIVPCGIRQYGVTSLHQLGIKADMPEVDAALLRNFKKIFGE